MKNKIKFLMHVIIGLVTVSSSLSTRRRSGEKQLVVYAKPHQINRYLLNALQKMQGKISIQISISVSNLAAIGELKRSGRLGSELLDHPSITFSRSNQSNIPLSIDYFSGQFENRLPIWAHPKLNEVWARDTLKIDQIVFAGSHQNAYLEFDESLWSMPNRLRQIEYVKNRIPSIQIFEWMSSPDYCRLLSTSNYFLCLPGYRMPLCHNLYEAIEFGCVPIVHSSYHKWLEPALRRATNSFIYSTMDELELLAEKILSGHLATETKSAKLKIQDWIDRNYGVDDIVQSSISKGEMILCAEEESVEIHKNRSK